MPRNKIVYGGSTLIDLTADTVTADKLAYGYTAHDQSGASIVGTMGTAPCLVLTKTLSYASKTTATQLIWTASEFGDFPYGSLEDYEFISMTAIKTDTTKHTTYHVTFSTSYYPYSNYRSGNYLYTGIMRYHGTSTTAVYSGYNSISLTGSNPGFFQISSNGINFVCNSSYSLYGTYLFSLTAKIAT